MNKNNCEHKNTEIIKEKEGSKHYARQICSKCKKFIKWMPKPKTEEALKKRQERIDYLLKMLKKMTFRNDNGFKEYIIKYLKSVKYEPHLSPKQQKFYNDINENLAKAEEEYETFKDAIYDNLEESNEDYNN
jgi:hypothetical protein